MGNENDFNALLKFYEISRGAIIARVGYRDNSILLYLTGCAAIIGIAIERESLELLLVLPFLSLGITGIVSHHHFMIGAHTKYICEEIEEALKLNGVRITQWDKSAPGLSPLDLNLRYVGDFAYLLIPSYASAIINSKFLFEHFWLGLTVWITIVATTIMIFMSFTYRRGVVNDIRKRKKINNSK
jgi:hypothetical protein